MPSDDMPFLRHLRLCNTAVVPGDRFPFSLGGKPAGWIDPAIADRLEQEGLGSRTKGFALANPAELEALGKNWLRKGFTDHIMNCLM